MPPVWSPSHTRRRRRRRNEKSPRCAKRFRTWTFFPISRNRRAPASLAGAGTASAQTTVITRVPVQTRTIVTKTLMVNGDAVPADPASSEVVVELAR
jgi:hypothetical protein